MFDKKKLREKEHIYSFSDVITEIPVVSDFSVKTSDDQVSKFDFMFPVGIIEKELNICSRLEYKALKDMSYKVVTDEDYHKYEHFLSSFYRFNEIYDEKYSDNIYFLEQCFCEDTRKFLYEHISGEECVNKESYMTDSMKHYLLEKYSSIIKLLVNYFLNFSLSDIIIARADYIKAISLFDISKYDKALTIFEELSSNIDIADEELFNYIGKCFYYLKDYKKAITNTAKCLEYNQSFYKAYHNLGVYYIALDDIANAEYSWKQVIKLKSDHKKAKHNLNIIKENLS